MILASLDTETTGLDVSDGHRIIEICIRCYDLATRRLKLNFVQRIDPQRSIQTKAQEVHGISLEDLKGCPTWEKVAPKVQLILSRSAVAVAHNAQFDMPFIGLELARVGLDIPEPKVFCTMENGRWATPIGKLPSLQELCFACGIDYDKTKAHAAEYDVEVMTQCLWFGMDQGAFRLPVMIPAPIPRDIAA